MLGPKPLFRPKIPSTTSETSDLDIGKELVFHNALSWIVLQNMSIFKQTKCNHLNSRSITARVTEHHRDEHQLYSTWPWQHRFVWKILFTQVGLICFTTWPRQCRLICLDNKTTNDCCGSIEYYKRVMPWNLFCNKFLLKKTEKWKYVFSPRRVVDHGRVFLSKGLNSW